MLAAQDRDSVLFQLVGGYLLLEQQVARNFLEVTVVLHSGILLEHLHGHYFLRVEIHHLVDLAVPARAKLLDLAVEGDLLIVV